MGLAIHAPGSLGNVSFLLMPLSLLICEMGLVWVALTKYHGPGGLNHENVFSHHSEGQKSKIKVSADCWLLFPSEAALLGLARLPSPQSVSTWPHPPCVSKFLRQIKTPD